MAEPILTDFWSRYDRSRKHQRDALLDPERLYELVDLLEASVMADALEFGLKPDHHQYQAAWLLKRALVHRALDHVTGLSESPIEQITMASYVIHSWLRDPYGIHVPSSEPDEQVDAAVRQMVLDGFGGRYCPHLMMQVPMDPMPREFGVPEGVGEALASMRVDAVIYIPGRSDRRLVVECDGYEFHQSQEAFTADRQRDRLLRRAGFDVIRFSGGEIWRDPIGVGFSLWRYVQERWAPFRPEEWEQEAAKLEQRGREMLRRSLENQKPQPSGEDA